MARPARDSRLLDAIEQRSPVSLMSQAWRVVRDGRHPMQCSSVGGRWDDRTFDVLYTSSRADGAIAEMYFHLARSLPVFPSQIHHRLFELSVTLASCLRLDSLDMLSSLGLQAATFGQMSYAEREREYPRTQEIAEAAHFVGRDGFIVPSARAACANTIVFCGPAGPAAAEVVIGTDGDRTRPAAEACRTTKRDLVGFCA